MCPKELQLCSGNGKVNNCLEHSVLRTQRPGNKEQWEDRKRSDGFCYGGDGERESEETLISGDILIGS